jgi:hypothetical protein
MSYPRDGFGAASRVRRGPASATASGTGARTTKEAACATSEAGRARRERLTNRYTTGFPSGVGTSSRGAVLFLTLPLRALDPAPAADSAGRCPSVATA